MDGIMFHHNSVIQRMQNRDKHKHCSEDDSEKRYEYHRKDATDNQVSKQDQLIDTNSLMTDVFNSIPDGISVLSKNLEIIKVNSFMEFLYQKKFPIIGKNCFEIYQGRENICPWCPSLKAIETKSVQTTIVPYPNSDDTKRWFSLSAFPLISNHGEVTGVIEYVKDVTEQRSLEVALREAKEKYERLFHTNPDAIVLLDKTGIITEVNNAALRILGLDKDDVIGKHFKELHVLKQEDYQTYSQFFYDIVNGKSPEPLLYEIIHPKTKKTSYLEAYIDVVRINGKITGVQVVSRNLTHKKQSDFRLLESQQRYQHLFDNAADLIAVVDAKGTILELNKRFEEESGYKKEEIIGKNLLTSGIVTKISAMKILTQLHNILDGREVPIFEIEGVTKQNDIIPYELRAVPLKKDNRIVGAQAILRNLSIRKQAEDSLKQKIDELETFQNLAVDREIQMVGLKNEINQLCTQLGQPLRYESINHNKKTMDNSLDEP
jgi:PAS domain S-box-containing protein